MQDPRFEKLADVLVNYSTGVRPGNLVRLAGPPVGRPLLVALYRAVIKAGGNVYMEMVPDECAEIKLDLGNEEQLRFEDPIALAMVERIDVSISLWGQDNTKSLSGTDPKRQAMVSQARKRQMNRFLARAAAGELRWVGTQFPCHAAAQDAQMSLAAYEQFVFRAGLLDQDDPASAWREISQRQQLVADCLNRAEEVRFTTPQGTDLKLGVEGRKWINCDGHENFPDGEVFTGPIEDATEGVVCYSFPAVHGGREVDGIRLKFRDGKVIDASASRGEQFLIAMLDQDPGARVLGEIALGTNYSVRHYTKNTLFDEKIGGTIHMALGRSIPESGGVNESTVHWDIVHGMQDGGEIWIDGELFYRAGQFMVG